MSLERNVVATATVELEVELRACRKALLDLVHYLAPKVKGREPVALRQARRVLAGLERLS